MKKFVAILLTTLSIAATLFTLSGCSSSSDGYTKKQWIEKSAPEIFLDLVYYQDEDGKIYSDRGHTEFDVKIKKLAKHSKYDDSYIYVPDDGKYYKVKTKNYNVTFIKYYDNGNIKIYDNVVYSISVVNCKHCNNFLRFGENKKYCKDCIKSFQIGNIEYKDYLKEVK